LFSATALPTLFLGLKISRARRVGSGSSTLYKNPSSSRDERVQARSDVRSGAVPIIIVTAKSVSQELEVSDFAGVNVTFVRVHRNRRQEPLPALQRAEEVQDILLLRRAERVEIVDYPVGLRATFRGVEAIVISIWDFAITVGMRLDGLQYIGGASVMQEKQALAEAPQWRSTELIRTRSSLVDTVRQTRAPL